MGGSPVAPAADNCVLRVVELDPRCDPRWETFVAQHPEGSVFHHPAWIEALARGSVRRPVYLACADAEGRLLGVLPLLETPGFWFNLGPQFLGRRLSSLPRTPMAGPLTLSSQATGMLVHAAAERLRSTPGITLELKAQSNELDGVLEGMVGVPWKENYVLELPNNPEDLRFGNAVTRHRIKWAVGKAEKLGVRVRTAETEEDLMQWYDLYLGTMRWHVSIPRPYRFIASLWELLRPRGLMRLLLAEHCQAGRRRLLSGYLLLMYGSTVHCYLNGRRAEDLGLHPNDVLQWRAIHDASAEGFRRYNFLETQDQQRGLAEFKAKWGAAPVRSFRYYYPGPRRISDPGPSSNSAIHRIASAAWRRMPLGATASISAWIHERL